MGIFDSLQDANTLLNGGIKTDAAFDPLRLGKAPSS